MTFQVFSRPLSQEAFSRSGTVGAFSERAHGSEGRSKTALYLGCYRELPIFLLGLCQMSVFNKLRVKSAAY